MRTQDLREALRRPVAEAARELVGWRLLVDGVGGTIVETEAYGPEDPASHGHRGPTARNASMFGGPGLAYVYVSYGVHHCLNLVCEQEGRPAAVLIRALRPEEGIEAMRRRRGRPDLADLCSGPGKTCQALAVDLGMDGAELHRPPFRLEPGDEPGAVVASPRVGISRALDVPWRFSLVGSPFVSRPRPSA